MSIFELVLSNIDASKGNRDDPRKFADRPVVKERRITLAVGLKEKLNERTARRITRKKS